MKKLIIILSLMVVLANAAQSQNIEGVADEMKSLNTQTMQRLAELSSSEQKLKEYAQKIDAYELKITNFIKDKSVEFSNKEDANRALDALSKLSSQTVVLAKTIVYLSSHQGDNANDSYQATLKELSKIVLYLSDDIGIMSDRILKMAQEIGVMADRIVETQKIQAINYQATLDLIDHSVNTASVELHSEQTIVNTHVNSKLQGNNNFQNSAATFTSQQVHQ